MSYPDGTVPTTEEVHPTPVYEAIAVSAIAYVLWRLRDAFTVGMLFALYLVLTGAERFLIEFIRRNDEVFLGLTQPQVISAVMVVAGGSWMIVRARRGELGNPRRPTTQQLSARRRGRQLRSQTALRASSSARPSACVRTRSP